MMERITFVFIVVTLYFCVITNVDSLIPLSRYRLSRNRGPNVCAAEEVVGTRKQYYGICRIRLPRKICGRKTFIRYTCCNGYELTGTDEKGCLGVSPVRDLMSTIKHRHVMDFVKYVQKSGLEEKFKKTGPYTLFLPHRSAYKDLDDETKMLLSTTDPGKNLIRMHAAEGRFYDKDLTNGREIPSIYYYQDEGMLKINKYSNGVKTVNCVRIILPDIIATNGIIHLTEKVINPYPNRGTLMDILLRDDRFGELVTALIVSDLGNELRDDSGHYTIFAPTDRAFRSAPREIMNRILSDKELVKKLLKYHQTNSIYCSPAVLGKTRIRSREGQLLNLTCDVDDKIRVNGVVVEESDIVALNGVIHVIDELLIPDSVKSLGDVIGELNMLKFIEYAQQAGLQQVLSGEAPGNYTIFVPKPEAFEALTEDQMMRLQTDSQFVKQTIKYHVVPELVTTHDMNDGQVLETMTQTPLRVTIYQKTHGVNSAMIRGPDNVVGNGVVHIIDKVLFPPKVSAMEIIKQDPRLTTFKSLLQSSGLDSLIDKAGHLTIFAPTNDAFSKIPRRVLETLTRDYEEMEEAIGYHILKKPVYTAGLRHGLQYRFQSVVPKEKNPDWLKLKIKDEDSPLVINDRVNVVEKDIESTTGVMHIVEDVLQCPCVELFKKI